MSDRQLRRSTRVPCSVRECPCRRRSSVRRIEVGRSSVSLPMLLAGLVAGVRGQHLPDGHVDSGQRPGVHSARGGDLRGLRADVPLDSPRGHRVLARSGRAGCRSSSGDRSRRWSSASALLLVRPGMLVHGRAAARRRPSRRRTVKIGTDGAARARARADRGRAGGRAATCRSTLIVAREVAIGLSIGARGARADRRRRSSAGHLAAIRSGSRTPPRSIPSAASATRSHRRSTACSRCSPSSPSTGITSCCARWSRRPTRPADRRRALDARS